MSDETPTPADEQPAADPADATGAVTTATTPAVPAEAAHPAVRAERVTFRNKFLMPLLVPIGVTATIVFYVLNVSRIFLAAEDALAVTYATIVTVLILGGGTALAASPKLRSSSLTLLLGFGFLVLMMGGLISIGAASPKAASGPVQCTPPKDKLTVDAGAGGALKYAPSALTAKAGCIQITMNIVSSSHTLQFDDATAANAFPQLTADAKTWAGTLPAGTYKFHCTIPGHEIAGMVGTLTVAP
ncbi:MAG TPA: plastocyanin/azurin family copper-binding protein [Acidimicrobiia bacterium]